LETPVDSGLSVGSAGETRRYPSATRRSRSLVRVCSPSAARPRAVPAARLRSPARLPRSPGLRAQSAAQAARAQIARMARMARWGPGRGRGGSQWGKHRGTPSGRGQRGVFAGSRRAAGSQRDFRLAPKAGREDAWRAAHRRGGLAAPPRSGMVSCGGQASVRKCPCSKHHSFPPTQCPHRGRGFSVELRWSCDVRLCRPALTFLTALAFLSARSWFTLRLAVHSRFPSPILQLKLPCLCPG
jgi:hypothetical protein